jgi:predicted CXXCH cytochrome family protein
MKRSLLLAALAFALILPTAAFSATSVVATKPAPVGASVATSHSAAAASSSAPAAPASPAAALAKPAATAAATAATAAAPAGSCLSASCHAGISTLKNLHQPVKDGDCLSCHVQKVRAHPVEKAKSFELSAAGGALCSQCHDPFKKKVVHAPVRKGECLSCHQPHGARNRFLIETGDDLSGFCFKCHDVAPFKKKYQHGPVAEGACTACHDPHDSTEKALLKGEARGLCLKCHEDFAKGMQVAARIHPPVKEKPCTSCHEPHSSSFPYLLKNKMPDLCLGCHKDMAKKMKNAQYVHKPLLSEKGCSNCHSSHFSKAKGLLSGDQKSICLGCHGTGNLGTPPLRNILAEVTEDKTLHGPIKNGKCGGCHDPHASQFPRILTGSYPDSFYAPYIDDAYGLCLKCHDKNLLRFPETTMYTKFRNGDRNLHFVHVVDRVKGRTCRACHESHGADGLMLMDKEGSKFGQWKLLTRFKKTPTGGSCAPGCHKSYAYDRSKAVPYGEKAENADTNNK